MADQTFSYTIDPPFVALGLSAVARQGTTSVDADSAVTSTTVGGATVATATLDLASASAGEVEIVILAGGKPASQDVVVVDDSGDLVSDGQLTTDQLARINRLPISENVATAAEIAALSLATPTAEAIRVEIDANSTQLTAIKTAVDAVPDASQNAAAVDVALVTSGDGTDLLQAVADKIAADWVAGDASPVAIVSAIKADTQLAQMISRIDVDVSSVGGAEGVTLVQLQGELEPIKGAGFQENTDSLESLRDRGDAAWTTGSSSGGKPTISLDLPDFVTLPKSGARDIGLEILCTTPEGTLQDPASTPAVVLTDPEGNTLPTLGTVTKIGTGRYRALITVSATHVVPQQIVAMVTATIGGVATAEVSSLQIDPRPIGQLVLSAT